MSNHHSSYDVIVVGLGAMGSATLYQLAKRGVRALGIDRFDPPHALGSTHGETRVTRLAVGEGPQYMPLVRRSHEIWRELEAATGESILTVSGGYVICPKGGGSWHKGSDFVAKTVALAEQNGIQHTYLTNDALGARQPLLKLKGNEHAMLEPSAGVVAPETAVRSQLAEAVRLGARVLPNTLVTKVDYANDCVSVETVEGHFSAEKVILSAGPWIADLLPMQHRKPFAVCRQVFYWFEPESVEQFLAKNFPWLLWIGDTLADFYSVFPIAPGNRPAVKVLTEQFHDLCHPDMAKRTVDSAEVADMHTRLTSQRLHGLTDRCIDATVCFYTMTPDDNFVLDWHPESDRVLLASPCSGHGFKHSAAIGEGLAQMAMGGEMTHDFSSFGYGRFSAEAAEQA